MAAIITFINEKGGVGKTSACFNSAWELSRRGKKILMIDMDGQKANLTFFSGSDGDSDSMKTMADVFKGDTDIKDTILSVRENLDIIPADSSMSNLGMEAKVVKFRKSIAEIAGEYDLIFIDVNPAPGWSHYLSLSVSNWAVIVMLPDIASLEGNKGILETIEEIQGTTNPALKILGFLFNKNNSRTVLAKQVNDAAESMAESVGSSLFDTKIRNTVTLSENVIAHVGVTEYAPGSPAAEDISAFADEMERRLY